MFGGKTDSNGAMELICRFIGDEWCHVIGVADILNWQSEPSK